jgi:glycerophosphoryl diester phosphodiesterase
MHVIKQQLTKEKPLVIGHRGALGMVPENTLASMQAAISAGCDMIEIDVHVLGSELVVFHDLRLERLTGQSGRLADVPIEKLKDYLVSGHNIPTLREAAALTQGFVGLNIELKSHGCVDAMASMYSEMLKSGWSEDDLLISSFDHQQLAELKVRIPTMRLGVLIHGIPVDLSASAEAMGAVSVNLSEDFITSKFIADAHSRGLKVYVYTVNYEDDMARLLDMGVDGMITDYPDLLSRLIKERYTSAEVSMLMIGGDEQQPLPASEAI